MCRYCSILLLLVAIFISCSKDVKEKNNDLVTVKVDTIQVLDGISTNHYIGTVEASTTSTLICKYSGKIVALNIKQGDFVKKGDVIAEIESQNVKSTLESAEATLAQAEDGYKRLKQVHDTRSVADVKMVEIETQLAKAKSAAIAARSAAEDCLIKAPFDCVIGEVFVSNGEEFISLNPICTIYDISSLQISISVPEKEIGNIAIGDSAFFCVEALDKSFYHAKVKTKGVNASKISRNYDCKLAVTDNLKSIMPGMIANVYFIDSVNSYIVISPKYVKIDEKGNYVWCVNSNNIVEKRYVNLGDFVASGVVINNGLSIGDKVVVDGAKRICSGTHVNIIP